MTPTLQVTFFIALVLFIIIATYVLIALELLRRYAQKSVKSLDEIKVDVKLFVHDLHQAGRTINDLSTQARDQMHEVTEIVQTAREWCDRADQIVKQVDEVIEPPLTALVHKMNAYRKGVGAFLQFFEQRRETHSKRKEEIP